jgi:hypothetical protein
MKSKTKKVSIIKRIKKNRILDMSQKCLLNHCLPEYEEYQEQIPKNFKSSLKNKNQYKNQSKKIKRITKSLERCSKKYCSK